MEEWVSVYGFKDYEVSSNGRVRNAITGKVLSKWSRGGYLIIGLIKDK